MKRSRVVVVMIGAATALLASCTPYSDPWLAKPAPGGHVQFNPPKREMPVSPSANGTQPRSNWNKFFTGAEVPADLKQNVDVYPNTRLWPMILSSPEYPRFALRPFEVTDFQFWSVYDEPPSWTLHVPGNPESDPDEIAFAFTLTESGQPRWECRCRWWAHTQAFSERYLPIPRTTRSRLRCDVLVPGGDRIWSLDQTRLRHARGIGMDLSDEGRLFSDDRTLRVVPLVIIGDSKAVGDIPGGFAIRTEDATVAALAMQTGVLLSRVVISRSASDDRALFMTVFAALWFGEGLNLSPEEP